MGATIAFSVQVIPDKFQLFEVSKDATFQKLLPNLLKSVKNNAELKDYRVLVAYQLVDPNADIGDLVRQGRIPS